MFSSILAIEERAKLQKRKQKGTENKSDRTGKRGTEPACLMLRPFDVVRGRLYCVYIVITNIKIHSLPS